MACGLPVITSPVGEVLNMVKPKMGIVLKNNTINESVEQLSNFKKTDFADPKDMHQYISSHYSMESVCNSITQLYYKYSR
jgi:glycosyltransferase involved in cell wall biosynthesis